MNRDEAIYAARILAAEGPRVSAVLLEQGTDDYTPIRGFVDTLEVESDATTYLQVLLVTPDGTLWGVAPAHYFEETEDEEMTELLPEQVMDLICEDEQWGLKATTAEIWERCAKYARDCHELDVEMYDPDVLDGWLQANK